MIVSIPLVKQASHCEQIIMVSTCVLQVNGVLQSWRTGSVLRTHLIWFSQDILLLKLMSWSLLRTVSQFAATVGPGCIRCSFTGSKKFEVHRCKCYKQNQNIAMFLIMEINESSARRDVLLQNK